MGFEPLISISTLAPGLDLSASFVVSCDLISHYWRHSLPVFEQETDQEWAAALACESVKVRRAVLMGNSVSSGWYPTWRSNGKQLASCSVCQEEKEKQQDLSYIPGMQCCSVDYAYWSCPRFQAFSRSSAADSSDGYC